MTDEIFTYVLVGAGGTGSVLAEPLVTWLTATHGDNFLLAIIDGDIVEEGNLARQIFRPYAVGQPKADALARRINHVNVFGTVNWVTDDNVAGYVREGDVVIIAADNYAVRRRILEHAKTLDNIRILNAGNEDDHGSLQDYIRSEGHDLTPPLDFMHPEIAEGKGVDPAELSCLERAALPGGGQTLAANFMSAAWILARLADPQNPSFLPNELHWDLAGKAHATKPEDFGWKAT